METLHSSNLSGKKSGSSTLKYVDVQEIRDGVIILKNGSLRSVIMISSVNFELKSSEEQDAIIMQYQNFLNSLDFPIEILISSRKLNIDPYIQYLKEKEKAQKSELLRLQTAEYANFIKSLTDVSSIMSKFFYVIVPFSPVESNEGGIFNKISSIFHPQQVIQEKKELFETYKNQLWQRVDHVIAGLSGTGVRTATLKTEELIELLYNSYNPTLSTNASVKNTDKLDLKNY